jgi:hypothetical protein
MTDVIEIYGTREPIPERRLLAAGPLTVVLEAGQLRDIRWHGIEVLRGIAWLVRDSGWRTLAPVLEPPQVVEAESGFEVRYRGRCTDDLGSFTLEATIVGLATGELTFDAVASIAADLTTNRTGFVVLHPDTVAGLPLEISHADGSREAVHFPLRIMADQPVFEIAALTHVDRGVRAEVRFDGGIFEMEDQRNWLDASFKTYVRPLRLPKPYVLPKGSVDRQSVTLRATGLPQATGPKPSPGAKGAATLPRLWLRAWPGADLPKDAPSSLGNGLIARADLSLRASPDLAPVAAFAARHGWPFAVEALLPLRDPAAEAKDLLQKLSGLTVDRLLIAGLRDLKSRPSGTIPEGEAPLSDAVAAIRASGFSGLIGAGTPAFFTEFNRNPPPPSDFAWFGGAAIVHAADDTSVLETAGVLPATLDSARALVPGTAIFPGPLTIAPWVSPYAPALAENPRRGRICMASEDPRHGAAFGAAHFAAVIARLVGEVEAAAPLWLNGPSGCIAPDGSLWPIGKLHAALASQAGAVHIGTEWHGPIFRVSWEHSSGGVGYLLCNTTETMAAVPHSWAVRQLAPYEARLGKG